MNYTLLPSLEHRALIKTAITVWNPGAIHLDDIEWRNHKWITEDNVIEKVKELPLPESLKKKISGFIKPIGYEILKWINNYQGILSNDEQHVYLRSNESLVDVKIVGRSLSKLCWTPQGTVDRKKTAEELIRDDNLDITERYKLACIYCLRHDILLLWNKMPEYSRKSFYSEDPLDVEQNILVVFWTYNIKGELTRNNDFFNQRMGWDEMEFEWKMSGCTPYEYAFLHAAEYCNKVATEYFLQNQTSERREELLIRILGPLSDEEIFSNEDGGDILIFLLSHMNEEQQSEALKKYSLDVLRSLLFWPWQDFFMETANHMWAFLSGGDHLTLLEVIINIIIDGYMDYDYKNLFREFWQKIPITHKEYVRDKFAHTALLLILLETKDEEYFKTIFASIPDREKLLFSDNGKSLCGHLIFYDKMDLLEVFLRECLLSKDIKFKFREEFEIYIILHHSSNEKTREEKADKLSKFFQLLDELILEDNDKSVDEGNTNPAAKRLCSHNK